MLDCRYRISSNYVGTETTPFALRSFQIFSLWSARTFTARNHAQSRRADRGPYETGPGTLYGSIRSLLEEKLIEEVRCHRDSDGRGERRRYYRVTSAGRKLLRA